MQVELIDKLGSDLTVVNAARVSYSKESKSFVLKDEKLIKYLAEHEHWSPFAHAFMQFRIKAPVFVARQLVKHQVGLVWNEVSRRYVDFPPELYKPDNWRGKPQKCRFNTDGDVISQQGIVWSRSSVAIAGTNSVSTCVKSCMIASAFGARELQAIREPEPPNCFLI